MPLIQNLRASLRDNPRCSIEGCRKRGVVYFGWIVPCEGAGFPCWECLFHFGVWSYIRMLPWDAVDWVKKRIT